MRREGLDAGSQRVAVGVGACEDERSHGILYHAGLLALKQDWCARGNAGGAAGESSRAARWFIAEERGATGFVHPPINREARLAAADAVLECRRNFICGARVVPDPQLIHPAGK